MNHLIDFLNSKRLPVKEVLTSPCQISEKIDGNALQVYYDQWNDTLSFGKRYDSNKKKSSNTLDIFDLVLNDVYYLAYNHLNQYTDILKQYRIINFEIFDSHTKHIIEYKDIYKNNIVLLSAFNFDGSEVSVSSLQALSDELNVSVRHLYYNGCLEAVEADLLMLCKDNPDDLWEYACNICKVDKERTDIEGFVFNYYEQNRVLKVQNPTFAKQLKEHLNNEHKDDEYGEDEAVGELVYDYIMNGRGSKVEPHSEYICTLVDMYKAVAEYDPVFIENILKKSHFLDNFQINIMPLENLYNGDLSKIEYPNLFKFILMGFRNKRYKKPLWCSSWYQLNVLNNFIENFNK